MPSLRRTLSSPAVRRSSPYSNATLVARGGGRRRSSGSETTNRRVLADIEWWKVTDGQCDPDVDQESEDLNHGDLDIISLSIPLGLAIHIDAGVEHALPTPLPLVSSFAGDSSIEHTLPPTEQFSSLSITPRTPTHRHHSLESSSSSLESTPEPADVPFVTLKPRFLISDLEDTDDHIFSFNRTRSGKSFTPGFAFADRLSMKDGRANQYADFAVSPLSSSPDFLN